MAKDGEAMKKQQQKAKKRWAPGKPLPKLATAAEEERFWLSHDFDDAMDAGGEEVVYEPRATRRPRTHVYRVRLDDQEMSKLQALAKRRGVTASVILRELVRAARVAKPGEQPRK
ncbi:MAG TPA: CopG family antitoxin [Anaeromyxobacter sp.]|nr:CopG family antitoxin [Anaeromyxobacter sp.]